MPARYGLLLGASSLLASASLRLDCLSNPQLSANVSQMYSVRSVLGANLVNGMALVLRGLFLVV
eukprot:NODE_1079_length_613_cov_142.767730_g71_i4.p1 GENE.NODE_1079_length_613_cov_142.767730_g71_i4~~NODE_1079_length_613_cov_142.767730_g71_i4.p1  ORF type:complete len:64 (-),score=0.68 NODE_1079_length_613_cov_142.767730_g71_i4:235-426(-)